MSENPTYPYTVDISEQPSGFFHWAIRERGKLLERADRPQSSERAARQKAESALERLFAAAGRDDRRR